MTHLYMVHGRIHTDRMMVPGIWGKMEWKLIA